jgi:hypothetical protein
MPEDEEEEEERRKKKKRRRKKKKVVPLPAKQAHSGSRDVALPILDPGP